MEVAIPPSLEAPELFINRELSWLAFNERVLAQAWDPEHPLLERVRFLAIVGSNLDEFFMIRIAVLQKQLRTERDRISSDGLTTVEQLTQARARALQTSRGAGPLLGRGIETRNSPPPASASWIKPTTRRARRSISPATSGGRSRRC